MTIGVDPHKSSHTATAVDPAMIAVVSSLRIDVSLAGYRELLRWAAQWHCCIVRSPDALVLAAAATLIRSSR